MIREQALDPQKNLIVRTTRFFFPITESLDGANLVIVHEWNSPDLVARIGRAAATRDDLLESSAVALASRIARRDVSSRDVVEAHIARIEAGKK